MTDRGFTLVEVLVVAAIVATIAGLLAPALLAVKANNDGQAPRVVDGSWYLRTVKHDDHLWVIENGGRPQHFVHHPDCPCLTRKPEKEQPQ